MAVNLLMLTVALLLVSNVRAKQTKCNACENICWEADLGIAKELTSPLNKNLR
jgi:hypothetical protein